MICMKVKPAKRMEMVQTITSLMGSMRSAKGCQAYSFYQNMGDGNEICLIGEWDCQENLIGHLRSEGFGVLQGAMHLLDKRDKGDAVSVRMGLFGEPTQSQTGGNGGGGSCG